MYVYVDCDNAYTVAAEPDRDADVAALLAAVSAAEPDRDADVAALLAAVSADEPDRDADVAALLAAVSADEPDTDADVAALVAYNKAFTSVAAFPPVTVIAPFILNTPPSQVKELLPAPLK